MAHVVVTRLFHLCLTVFLSFCLLHWSQSAPLPADNPGTIVIRAVVGEPALLPCHTRLPVGVVWMFQHNPDVLPKEIVSGEVVVNGNKERFELDTASNGDYNLVIKSAKLLDAGLYTCDEDEGVGQRHYVRVDVADRYPDTVEVSTGQNVSLACHLASLGTTPSWYYKTSPTAGRQVVSVGGRTVGNYTDRFSVTTSAPGQHNLDILSVRSTDSGLYICIGDGQRLAERRMDVIDKSQGSVSTINMVHSTSSRVVLPCRPSTQDSVQWTYQRTLEDQPTEISVSGAIVKGYEDRFELEHSYNLVIKSATSADSGQYMCTENNGRGLHKHEVNFISEGTVQSFTHPAVIGVICLSVFCCIITAVSVLVIFKIYRSCDYHQNPTGNDDDESLLDWEKTREELEQQVVKYRRQSTAADIDTSHNLLRDTFIYELTKHQPVFDGCAKLMAEHIRRELNTEVDVIIGVNGFDSRGDRVASRMAGKLGLPFVEMFDSRRSTTSTNDETNQLTFKSKLKDDEEDYTMEILKTAYTSGQRVVIVDNAVTTGAAMEAASQLATDIGLVVVECMCLVKAKSAPLDGLKCKVWHLFEH